MPIVEYGRCRATNPGKHGDKDWRVDFNGHSPTIHELVFMVGMFVLAEDRYDGVKRNGQPQDGRYRLWYYMRDLVHANDPELVKLAADAAMRNVESSLERNRTLLNGPLPPRRAW